MFMKVLGKNGNEIQSHFHKIPLQLNRF